MRTTILITGAAGFLGTQVARQILLNSHAEIFALLRAPDTSAAHQRLLREWWDWPDLRAAIGGRVQALAGDVTLPHLGLTAETYAELTRRVTHIIHTAADIRLFAPIEELRQVNVNGVCHALELAYAAQADHNFQRFAHVSTAYVAGKRSGPTIEEELSNDAGFNSPYECSKYEAEVLVRQAAADLPVSIFRPGLIVGDSRSGVVKTFNTLYYPMRLYLTGRLRLLPVNPSARVNLVPVDYVAGAISRLVFDQNATGQTFHLTPPPEALPTLAEIAGYIRTWAAQEMGVKLPRPCFLPFPGLEQAAFLFKKFAGQDLAPLAHLLPYFQGRALFLPTNTRRLLGPYPHHWQDLLPLLLDYAVRRSFWHRSTRTVHEQILFRLQSKTKPIVYHDLADGQEFIRPASDIREEILAAAASIRALGVTPGQRIAIVGPNSSRYFSMLVACGLSGVMISPLYPTCPPKEIESLLKDCNPRLFLVGAREILDHLDEIQFTGPVVSLRREAPATGGEHPVLSWQEFLELGVGQQDHKITPLAMDAPAALFYTSGTTGQPKGVVYHHEHLRWLAETLAGMYPWRERNRWGSYLSYLPMNHVVEGILAVYSPYYVPAALDIYFLEKFDDLPLALKKARPTIFFSVPRFFEKVQIALSENPLAKVYLALPKGVLRGLLRRLLKRGLLRKTGLDGCRQMIVGSAPCAQGLLAFFQELGVEVHDAYGLTEAPLISLNRLGRNQVGTAGEPLPETEIRFYPDGEIRVAGPQVAAGYYENGKILAYPGGWLKTGDLGRLTPEGYLELSGRKKDMMITSYSRNIFPGPIEAGLRAAPGVAEVLLVGEGRPYCIALFWMEENAWNLPAARTIEEIINATNSRLSHPEQIKRWAILPGSLTVANGCLTGSMKIKRAVVTARLAAVIDALYRGETPPGVLHSSSLKKS